MWSALERFSIQGVQFVVMLIMARLLTPADYGLVGMLTVFMAVAQVFIYSGFGNALVRKQDRTQVDCSTVFYFNLGMSVIMYAILFFCAPLIAVFYKESQLVAITRVVGLTLIINAFGAIQGVLKSAEIDFKIIAKVSVVNAVITGLIGILLAWNGFGVWALVYSSLIGSVVGAILGWFVYGWRPTWAFSTQSFKEFFGYGSKLAIVGLIETAYNNLVQLVIGKVYSVDDLGYYTRASNFATFFSSNVVNIVSRVTFPILCKLQNEDDKLRLIYRKFLRLSAFVVFPLMSGLAILSHPLIIVLIGNRWEFSASILSIVSISAMIYPIHAINSNLLQVKGRSDLFLRVQTINKILGLLFLMITWSMGVLVMCYSGIVWSILTLIINTYYTGKLLDLGICKQLLDLLPMLGYTCFMAIIVIGISHIMPTNFSKLIVGIISGGISYIGISYFTKSKELFEIISLLRSKVG